MISVENVGSEPIYCSCSPFEYDEINTWLAENNRYKNSLFFDYTIYLSRPTQTFGTMFKQMKKHSRMKCFKYNRDIEDDWSNKTRNMNSDQLQEALKHFASVSFVFDNGLLTKAFSSILCWHGIFIPKLDNQF